MLEGRIGRVSAIAIVVLLGAVDAGEAQQFRDVVQLASGARETGVEVTLETLEKVDYMLPGSVAKSVAGIDVRHIDYANAPEGIRSAYSLWVQGDFEGAAAVLSDASLRGKMGPAASPDLLETYAKFYLADSLLNLGGKSRAAKARDLFAGILSGSPGAESRFSLDAKIGLGQAAIGAGDWPEAKTAFEEAAADSRLGGLPPAAAARIRFLARMGLVDLASAQGDAKAALDTATRSRDVASAAGAAFERELAIATGELLVASGNGAEAGRPYEEILKRLESGQALGEAERSGAATALVVSSLSLSAAGDPFTARERLARLAVYFSSFPECHAASLGVASSLHRDLAKRFEKEMESERDESMRSQKENQAKAARELGDAYERALFELYPRSRWARRMRSDR